MKLLKKTTNLCNCGKKSKFDKEAGCVDKDDEETDEELPFELPEDIAPEALKNMDKAQLEALAKEHGFTDIAGLDIMDEDGYISYVGRTDDVIKSSGYRIGPFEIENVIMELPYVLECGVSAEPDEVRGQVVKASIVLVKGTQPTEELKKEIQKYVKERTAPYKYPRIVVFRDELPKTISGKIQRNKL